MLCNDAAPVHPPLGTLIDDDSLELVEVLGVGGYGVVYRAEETCCSSPKSYAVKCLLHRSSTQSARQRQIHIREIALHQLASAHPNVVTLHRVIEDYACTYIIMDYAPDHDLFHQILHNCRYLGNDYLVKHIFLQILDAVEYCHSLGIYHRDLKPENVLCYDDGLRVAITDFGLATTDKVSEEFRTGSVYHMSPECQGGEFAPTGSYSPMFNDIWSLGIILLNLATGRNPWKSASISDPTFQAYLRDPLNFLPTVLPISPEVNSILVRMLEIDWRDRMTIPELRLALEDVDTFYSDSVIFEGSMAKCGWESGIEIDSDSTKHSAIQSQTAELKSHWSQESFSSDIVFASHSAIDSPWVGYPPFPNDAYAMRADAQPDYQQHSMVAEGHELFTRPQTPPSIQSPFDLTFGGRAVLPQRKPLVMIDTSCVRPPYLRSESLDSGSVVEYPSDVYAAETFFGSSMSNPPIAVVQSVRLGDSGQTTEDKPMASPTAWEYSATQVSRTTSMYSSTKHSYTTTNMSFDNRSSAPSPEPLEWSKLSSRLQETCPPESQPSLPLYMTNASNVSHPPIRSVSPARKNLETKLKATFFTPLKFFPRHSSGQNPGETMVPTTTLVQEVEIGPAAIITSMELLPPSTIPQAHPKNWSGVLSTQPLHVDTAPIPQTKDTSCRKPNHRSPSLRHWFFSSKLFPSAIVS
ncbi:kinase-like domain-containing protein [Lentinula raphanica]|nr:kinase-like domain-containing protein [Lentinula raphanica]KAJ3768490.1 kinase-like domain-containing protein [Lentinula raphanica]KAJ3822618.1 kinase-like domain-containing protein [Lentinula raphanica]